MRIDIRHHTLTASGIRQHNLEAGAGTPVALLHGLPETNALITWFTRSAA